MDPLLFSILVVWALMRYGATDLVAAVRGTESPRRRERSQRQAQRHERRMANLKRRQGPTIGEAIASRITSRIQEPKQPKPSASDGPARRFFAEWWADSWNDAAERRYGHHQKRQARRQDQPVGEHRFMHAKAERTDRPAAGTTPPAADEPDIVDGELVEETVTKSSAAEEPAGQPAAAPAHGRPCEFLISTDTPGGKQCGRPAAGRWHEDDDEWFCQAHLGERQASAAVSICPQCLSHAGYDLPDCATCGHALRAGAESVHQPVTNLGGQIMSQPLSSETVSGETVDPQAALAFTQGVGNVAQQLLVELETSIGNLTEHGVSGEPINQLHQMQEAAQTMLGSAETAATFFANHVNIQDVATSDETVGGGRYLGVGS